MEDVKGNGPTTEPLTFFCHEDSPPMLRMCPHCGTFAVLTKNPLMWLHEFECCSPACGEAFAETPKRAEFEIRRLMDERMRLSREIDSWKRRMG